MLGKYELEKQLSDNGRIITYLARDQAGRAVLLKVLPPHRRTPESIARLAQQAELLASIEDARIPRVLETGEVDGYHLIALEYAEGKTLAASLEERQRAPFDPTRALDILGKAAEVLEVIHARGVIHGNLTPQDILVTGAGDVQLLGLGEADANAWVSADTPLQVARYLAPEQLEPQGEADARADVYALGVILYEMLTGRPPFEAALLNTLMYAVLRSNVRIPTLHNPALSDEIEEVILKAMARDPQARYPAPQALIEALRQAIANAQTENSPGSAPRHASPARSAIPRAAPATAAATQSLRTMPMLEARTSPASTELPRGSARRYRDRLRRRDGSSWGGAIVALTIVALAIAIGLGILSSRPGLFALAQPSATLVPPPTPSDTPIAETPTPEIAEEPTEETEEPVGAGTATHTVNPRRTLKAQGTNTPTPEPTRTKVFALPTEEVALPPTETPLPTATPVEYPAGNLLRNPGFEGGFSERGSGEVSIAEGWQPWWQDGPGQQEGYYRRPEYKPEDADLYGGRRVRSGRFAQKLFNTFSTHNAGIYQQVSVAPGGRCTFSIWVQVWSSRDPNPDTSVDPGNYRVMVGIDPTGGTDWSAASVIWGEQRVEYDDWIYLSVSAIARGDHVTVFTRSFPEYRVQFNDSYWDDAELYEEAP